MGVSSKLANKLVFKPLLKLFFGLPYRLIVKPLLKISILALWGWWSDMPEGKPKVDAATGETVLKDRVGNVSRWVGYVQWILIALAVAWFFGGKAFPLILMAAFVITLRITNAAGVELPQKKFIAIWKKQCANPLILGALVLVGVLAPIGLTLTGSSLDRAGGLAAWAVWIFVAHVVAADCARLHKEDRSLTAQYAVQLGKSFGVTAQAFDDRAEMHMVDFCLVIYPAPAGATSVSSRAEVEPALADHLPDFELDGERSSASQLVLKPLTEEGALRRETLKATQGMIQRFDDLPAKEKV